METVDLEDLSLELLLISALHHEAERLAADLPGPADGRADWRDQRLPTPPRGPYGRSTHDISRRVR
ncbi:hypothetical protein [Sphaerisporangium dianthi]|uniref:Acyl-CoA carboxylase subunit epsilon n=1 Tax=Sphaerisporangium dianthi TaxID=1436120 RepID=A0ABV9CLE3_9ACTN